MIDDIIDSYARTPLGRYLDIIALPQPDDDRGADYIVSVLAILYGMTEDAVLDLPLPEFRRRAEAAHFLTQPLPRSDGKRIAKAYRLGDLTLAPVTSAAKMTAAQYVDFQQLNSGDPQSLPAMLSCVLVPEGHRYGEGYDFADVRRAIADLLTVNEAEAISAFFLRRYLRSTLNTLTSFRLALRLLPRRKKTKETRELAEKVKALTDLLRAGAGWQTWTR